MIFQVLPFQSIKSLTCFPKYLIKPVVVYQLWTVGCFIAGSTSRIASSCRARSFSGRLLTWPAVRPGSKTAGFAVFPSSRIFPAAAGMQFVVDSRMVVKWQVIGFDRTACFRYICNSVTNVAPSLPSRHKKTRRRR